MWSAAPLPLHLSRDTTGLLARLQAPMQAQSTHQATLTFSLGGRAPAAVQDPISGALLSVSGGRAAPAARRIKHPQPYSRRLYLANPLDVAIHQLRNCPTVSRGTNEKIGTAGAATGVDPVLTAAPARGGSRRPKQQSAGGS
jgi:hypothetical protein